MQQRIETGRAAVFEGAGRPLEIRDFPLPTPERGEALVRIECCTICGSDLHTITGKRTEAVPSILGHEIVGVVTTVGDPPLTDLGGSPLAVGDRVTWSTSVSCGQCHRCQRGLPQKCTELSKYGHERAVGRAALNGGFAEFILLRSGSAVVKLETDLPKEVICPANCATATIVAAFRRAGSIEGRRVLIFGAGMLGLTAAAYAETQQAALVAICDPAADRLARAADFGANATIEWTDDQQMLEQRLAEQCQSSSFDVILELSGAPSAAEAACLFGDIGANVILVGTVMESRSIAIDPQQLVRRWLSICGVHNYAPQDLQTAVSFLEQFHDDFPFALLVEESYPLAKVNDAIDDALRNRPIRVAIHP